MKKQAAKKITRLYLIIGAVSVLVCTVLGVAAWTAANTPAFASIIGNEPAPVQAEIHWAQVDMVKPMANPVGASAFSAQTSNTPVPTLEPSPAPSEAPPLATPTDAPTSVPTQTPTSEPVATETPGEMMMEIVPNTPTSEYIPSTSAPKPAVASDGSGTRWIDVDLTNQRVYAYEGDTVVNSFIVSTGTWLTPTITGQYKIYIKYLSNKMSGPGYYLPDVPYIMYFHGNYGLHGTYWHNNFGTPMSHGCVNLSIADAGWLYEFASVGTLVNIHY